MRVETHASSELQAKRARLNERRSAPGARNGGFSLPAAGCRSYLRQKEDGMVRDPWIVAAALFAFGVIGGVVVAERPPKSPVRIEAARTLAADPDLRLVSERNPYMRTER
jgi:hypothetical protein